MRERAEKPRPGALETLSLDELELLLERLTRDSRQRHFESLLTQPVDESDTDSAPPR